MKHPKSGPQSGPKSDPSATTSKPNSKRKKQPIQAIEGSLARHGKIARLPRRVREELNRHLEEGYGGPQLLRWLNGLPETRRVLKEHFDGQPISQQNLSQWRHGGYRQWLLQQEASEALSEFAAGTHDVEQKMGLELADKLALWLCMRYAVMTRHLERMEPQESWNSMRQMCRDVVALRRGDFKLREQKLKEARQYELTEEDHRKWASRPGRLEQLMYEKTHDQKLLRQIKKEKDKQLDIILGIAPAPEYDEEEENAESPEPHAAPASGPGQPVKSSNSKPPPASGKTKCHKVKQSKTKCDCEVATASPGAQASARQATEKSQKEQTPVQPAVPTAGPAAEPAANGTATPTQPVAASASATRPSTAPAAPTAPVAASAPAPPKSNPGVRLICFCGARGQIPLTECKLCKARMVTSYPPCPCHDWPTTTNV